MANSQDQINNSISVDSDLFLLNDQLYTINTLKEKHIMEPIKIEYIISTIRKKLDEILILEGLYLEGYCFIVMGVAVLRNYQNENNAVAKLDVEHSPMPNRCSHSDIIIKNIGKPGSILSNAKFKKLKRTLAKRMVHFIIYDTQVEYLSI